MRAARSRRSLRLPDCLGKGRQGFGRIEGGAGPLFGSGLIRRRSRFRCRRPRDGPLLDGGRTKGVEHDLPDAVRGGAVDGPLHHVFQLPDVARPGVGLQLFQGRGGERRGLLPAQLPGHPSGKVIGQNDHVSPPLPQGRQGQDLEGEPVQKILLEFALPGQDPQIQVGGAQDPDIHLHRPGAAHPLEDPVLHHPQDLFLGLQGNQPDLVQEQGPPVGGLEPAGPAAGGAGKGPGLVSEQLRFHQGGGQGRAVECGQGGLPAGREIVEPGRGQLLAGAPLPDEENRPVHPGHPGETLLKIQELLGLAQGLHRSGS